MKLIETLKSTMQAAIGAVMTVHDKGRIKKKWTICKYANQANFEAGILSEKRLVFRKNLLLNEGITALQNLLIGDSETAFSEANSYIGTGDSATAAAAGQTGLQASTNKYYQAVESGYPTITNQTTRWRAIFAAGDGNYAWNEITVASGNSDSADNLNRLVQAMGTKASPAVWTVDLDITWS